MKKGKILLIAVPVIFVSTIAFLFYGSYRREQLSKYHMRIGEHLIMIEHDYANGIKELEKALKLYRMNAHVERRLIEAYLRNKRYKDAEEMLRLQLKYAPDKFRDLVRYDKIGEICIKTNAIDEAIKIYDHMVATYGYSPAGFLGLSTCHEKQGNLPEAIENKKKAIEILKGYNKPPLTRIKEHTLELVELYRKNGQEEIANRVSLEIKNIN